MLTRKSSLLLLCSLFLFFASFICPSDGIPFIGKIALLFLSFCFYLLFFIKSKYLLNKKWNYSFNNKRAILFAGIMLAFYIISSFLSSKGFSRYQISIFLDPTSHFTQAKIFAKGLIHIPTHELKDFFTTGYFLNYNGHFFSKYPPGWPLALSLGILLKLPWIINPILTALSLILIYILSHKMYDSTTATITIILAAVSPFLNWAASSYFSEPLTLLFSTVFFYGAISSITSRNILFPILAGLSLGIVFLTRPLTSIALSLPMIIYYLYKFPINTGLFFRSILLILSFLPMFFLHLAYNWIQTGSPWLLPRVLFDPLDKPGFGFRSLILGMDPIYFGPIKAFKYLGYTLTCQNWEGLPLLFLFIFFAFTKRQKKGEIILLLIIVSIIGFHFFYFARTIRLHYSAWFAFIILAGRGIILLDNKLIQYFRLPSFSTLKNQIVLFPVFCSLLMIIPYKIEMVKTQNLMFDPFMKVSEQKLSNAIVFLKSVPITNKHIDYYIQNLPDIDDSVLFVRDLGDRNILLMEYYSNRSYYYYDYDNDAGKGSLVPITKESLLNHNK